MKEWKLMIFILPLAVCSLPTAEAAELKGRISDPDGNPVDFASVRICGSDSSLIAGSVADIDGRYTFDSLPSTTVYITASCIGYRSTTASATLSEGIATTCDIELTPEADALNGITVTAEKFIRTSNGVTVIPGREQKKHASSGYELVRNLMIPGVLVNPFKGTVSALGGSVTLYIDGMKADEREVRQLRPEDVERVQYMDAPSGRYAGDNVALNFIMKKQTSGGYVALDAMQRIGYTNGDYNLAAKYFAGNTQYTLFTGTDYKGVNGRRTDQDEHIMFPEGTIGRHYSTIAGKSRKDTQYGQLRVRNKNDRRTLRATLNIVRDATPEEYDESLLEYSGVPTATTKVRSARSRHSRAMKYSLGLSGTFSLPHRQSIDASASGSVTSNSYNYTYGDNLAEVSSGTSEDMYNFHASLDYVKTFSHGNSLSVKTTEIFNVSSANYRGSHPSWQHLWMSEFIAFAEYLQPLGKTATIRLAPGFSAQAYRLHGRRKTCNYSPRAQVVFTLQPGRSQFIHIGAALGNSYPQLEMLSGATTQVDIFQQRRGNPDLKQTRIIQAQAVYVAGIGKTNFQLSALYTGASPLPVTSYTFEDGILIQSFRGDGRWTQLNPTLSATWMPSNRLNVQLSGGWLYNAYRRGGHATSACWTADAQASYYLGDFAINAFMSSPKRIAGYDLVRTRTIWDFGLSGSWSHNGLRIEAGIHNPLYRRPYNRQSLSTSQYSFDNRSYTPSDRQSAWIKASWTVDFGKKTEHDKQNIDKTINSGILRAR